MCLCGSVCTLLIVLFEENKSRKRKKRGAFKPGLFSGYEEASTQVVEGDAPLFGELTLE